MKEKIINCFDSHTHLWATGQVAEGLKLQNLKNSEDVRQLKINSKHYRANWLVGFGWNQNNWVSHQLPNKKILDEVFSEIPVFFSRVDGHSSWINSRAIAELQKLGYDFSVNPQGGVVERDEQGELTGILKDQAHIQALLKLPDYTSAQHQSFLVSAQNIFNRAGFTHIRDMSLTPNIWTQLNKMENEKNLNLCVESFMGVENINDLDSVLSEIKLIKKEHSEQIRLSGVKIYTDGSLGSQTAYLSKEYKNTKSVGIQMWSYSEIIELIKKTWQQSESVAIHCIGDEAVHLAAVAAREVAASGILGRLHLEHVQLLRPETLQLLKPLHVTCHMQPCHWLSDHSWLSDTIDNSLRPNLFQWELLRKNKIPIYFGSDSPIEEPSLFNTKKALEQSAAWGVPQLNMDWKLGHSHSDKNWFPSCTEIENSEIKQVYFNKRPLF